MQLHCLPPTCHQATHKIEPLDDIITAKKPLDTITAKNLLDIITAKNLLDKTTA